MMVLTACLALISYIWVDNEGFFYIFFSLMQGGRQCRVRRCLLGQLCFIGSIVNESNLLHRLCSFDNELHFSDLVDS